MILYLIVLLYLVIWNLVICDRILLYTPMDYLVGSMRLTPSQQTQNATSC